MAENLYMVVAVSPRNKPSHHGVTAGSRNAPHGASSRGVSRGLMTADTVLTTT